MTRYTAQQRQQIIDQARGKRVDSLEYEPDGDYWVMALVGESDDYSELSFRFMADLQRP